MVKKENEISLKDFFLELFKVRYYILFFIIIFLALSSFFIINNKNTYEGSITINPISNKLYNEISSVSQFSEFRFLTREFLLDTFIEEILDRSEVVDALIKFNFYDANQFASNNDYTNALLARSFGLKIFMPDENERIFNLEKKDAIVLNFSGEDSYKVKNLISYILLENNKKVITYIKNLLNNKISQMEIKKNSQINQSKYKLDRMIEVYERENQQRLEFLKEQSKIAKALSIDQNMMSISNSFAFFGNQQNIESSSELTSEKQLSINEQPYYFRGYIAIDAEIENLLNRDLPQLYIPEIINAELDYLKLKEDDRIQTLESAIQELNINDNFSVANFNVANIKLTNISISKINLFLLSFMVAILLSLLGVLSKIISKNIYFKNDDSLN